MKLLHFRAQGVHGYLDFDVDFRPDVNFFAGLNGSGKTTALNMIMALLTPSVDKLLEIRFSNASLTVEKAKDIIRIECNKIDDDIRLSINNEYAILGQEDISYEDIHFSNRRVRAAHEKSSDVIRAIRRLASPMFLSLDRRFVKSSRDEDYPIFFDENMHRAIKRRGIKDDSLDEIVEIVAEASAEAKTRQSAADNKLRNEIILDSLSFAEINGKPHFPDNQTIRQLRHKQKAIKKTFDNLEVPSDEFEVKYNDFFDNLENLVKRFERIEFENSNRRDFELDEVTNKIMSNWFINQHQLDRIDRLFSKVESYQSEKNRIYARLSRFEMLVNKFLNETGKRVQINNKGRLTIRFSGEERDLSVLSSGERQIVIMLAHLVLNKRLRGDGVFIVDEPELSLHISWQDMFVDAIQEASPNLQIILATHSPSIIGGRNYMYVPLNGGH
ncbi:AAA family ATPase [Vibrio vulnificus]|nr:AAA family ATPase [Vibrio vulnificus]EIV1776037.1 AAA family ATPase [Vibrio vulnificus]EIZ0990052.1 AAA family ATPase [Vibrio vulnificus]EJE8667834.1 AAA family ATPase [Vibrio vulnificus]ELX4147045.1 AAA family ATPase [Vibrio vulnificus]